MARNYVKWRDAGAWRYYFFEDSIPPVCCVARQAIGSIKVSGASVWRQPQHASWTGIATIGYNAESQLMSLAQYELNASEEANITPDAREYRLRKAKGHLQILVEGYPNSSERKTVDEMIKDINMTVGMLGAEPLEVAK
jgi:hypothetical protein